MIECVTYANFFNFLLRFFIHVDAFIKDSISESIRVAPSSLKCCQNEKKVLLNKSHQGIVDYNSTTLGSKLKFHVYLDLVSSDIFGDPVLNCCRYDFQTN